MDRREAWPVVDRAALSAECPRVSGIPYRLGPQIDLTSGVLHALRLMEKDDARRLIAGEQHESGRQVIRAHKRGRTRSQIAVEIGLSYTAVTTRVRKHSVNLFTPATGRQAGV